MARVKESGKIMVTALPKGKELKGQGSFVEGDKPNPKNPKKPPKKVKYKK